MKRSLFVAINLCFLCLLISVGGAAEKPERRWETDILKEVFGLTSDAQSDYPLADIHQGCPAPDCIPAIDKPVFVPVAEVDFLRDDDLVLGLIIGADKRAYSARILQRHEIVNDRVDGQDVAITYCPLCGSGVAFSRVVDGVVETFGVSGVLHGSDLVLYDRGSKSLWQQITGQSFAGPRRGQTLERLPLHMTDWGTWRKKHPDSRVLAVATNSEMEYERDYFADYRHSDAVRYGGVQDPRLHAKRVIYGLNIAGVALAIDAELLDNKGTIPYTLGTRTLEISLAGDGLVSAKDVDSDQTWPAHRMFWFAWYTFNTDTRLVTDLPAPSG